MEHRIEITPARRWNGSSWVGHGTYYASHEGQRIGEWRVPECDAARWLKANLGAADTDILITHRPAAKLLGRSPEDGSTRNGIPCMRGSSAGSLSGPSRRTRRSLRGGQSTAPGVPLDGLRCHRWRPKLSWGYDDGLHSGNAVHGPLCAPHKGAYRSPR